MAARKAQMRPVVITGPGGAGKRTRAKKKRTPKIPKELRAFHTVETNAKGPGTARDVWLNGQILSKLIEFERKLKVTHAGIWVDDHLRFTFAPGDKVTIGELDCESVKNDFK